MRFYVNMYIRIPAICFFICFISGMSPAQNDAPEKNLKFLLEVKVLNHKDSLPLEFAKLKLIGIDSTEKALKISTEGIAKTALKPNTSYTLVCLAEGFLRTTAHVTTIGETNSLKIRQTIYLQPAEKCIMYFPVAHYKKNDFKHPVNPLLPDLKLLDYFAEFIIDSDLQAVIKGFQESDEKKVQQKEEPVFS